MKYLTLESTDPYYNMSFDEFCLEQLPSDDSFFYLWRNRPAVIIGLNQNVYSEVNLRYLDENGIALARRVTGGGAVYHDLQNLNYTFIGRGMSPQTIADALKTMGVEAILTGRNDIYVDGRKVSGYARRVWRDREMIHGTLMYDVDIEPLTRALDVDGSKLSAKGIASVRSRVGNLKESLPQYPTIESFRDALHDILACGDSEYVLSEEQLSQVRRTAAEKFSSWEWIYGRSHEADLARCSKLPCGTVEASICLDRGKIASVTFSGDFLGDLPPEGLGRELEGVRFTREDVSQRLSSIDVGSYFEGTSSENLLDMIFNE